MHSRDVMSDEDRNLSEMGKEYVETRLERLTASDLNRKPNKWLMRMPQYRVAKGVLDIACGLGYDSLAWARAGKTVVGIDFNHQLVKNAQILADKEGLHVRFIVGDATCLPFPDESFDVCFSENLFEHVPNWERIAMEAYRVLRDGGILFVRTSNHQCPINHEINHFHFYPMLPKRAQMVILKWIRREHPGWINYSSFPAVNWFTHRGLGDYLRQCGFETCEIFDLVNCNELFGWRKRAKWLIELLKNYKLLRYAAYLCIPTVQLVAVKKMSSAPWGYQCSGAERK